MIELGQQVRIRNGVRAGEMGVVIDSEICDRKTSVGWQPCAFWYIEFASSKAVGLYEEMALDPVAALPTRTLSISAGRANVTFSNIKQVSPL
ncbi:MAG: hypothetical protein ABR577_15020 [Pyrinomonadaceae bacterium]